LLNLVKLIWHIIITNFRNEERESGNPIGGGVPSMCNTNILCILLIRRVVFLVSYHVVLDVAMTRESLFYYFVILLFYSRFRRLFSYWASRIPVVGCANRINLTNLHAWLSIEFVTETCVFDRW